MSKIIKIIAKNSSINFYKKAETNKKIIKKRSKKCQIV